MDDKAKEHVRETTIALGKVIQAKRLRLGISQEKLAHRAQLHRTYITDVERGWRNLSLGTVMRIALALDVRVSYLLQSAEKLLKASELECADESDTSDGDS